MKKALKIIGGSIVGLFALFIILGIIFSDEDKTAEPKKESVKAETKKEEPVKEEKVDQPTKEEVKAQAEAEAEKEKETAYRAFVVDHTTHFQDVFTRFSKQMSSYSPTQDWTIDTAVVISEMAQLVKEAKEYQDVPVKYQAVHAKYMQAMDQYGKVADELPTAIDNLDGNKMNELTQVMAKGNEYVTEASQELANVN